eukprot:8375645-Pyramimonas_sp.AAC.1
MGLTRKSSKPLTPRGLVGLLTPRSLLLLPALRALGGEACPSPRVAGGSSGLHVRCHQPGWEIAHLAS